jgi:hypothetical protein
VLPVELVLLFAGQDVHTVACCSVAYVPNAQATQVLDRAAPDAVEKVPAKQAAHDTVPVVDANVPATQAEQAAAPPVEKVPALQLAQAEPMTLVGGETEVRVSTWEQVPPRHQEVSLLPRRMLWDVSCRVQ